MNPQMELIAALLVGLTMLLLALYAPRINRGLERYADRRQRKRERRLLAKAQMQQHRAELLGSG